MNCTIEQIVDLTKVMEEESEIEWGNLAVGKDEIYQLIASQVYDLYGKWASSENKEAVVLATITKLVIENFLLNLKLESLKD